MKTSSRKYASTLVRSSSTCKRSALRAQTTRICRYLSQHGFLQKRRGANRHGLGQPLLQILPARPAPRGESYALRDQVPRVRLLYARALRGAGVAVAVRRALMPGMAGTHTLWPQGSLQRTRYLRMWLWECVTPCLERKLWSNASRRRRSLPRSCTAALRHVFSKVSNF